MRKGLALVVFTLLLCSTQPARAQFCPGASPWVFDDVPSGDLFCGYITWAAQNGITLGCAIVDANHRLYCPGDPVRRDQMAAFVNRLGNIRVEAVGTGPGLTGGPITGVGTINLAATQLLPTTACTSNQIARWNGSAWVCSTDANSGGTVTSIVAGSGLSGGTITASGTIAVDTAAIQARVTGTCAAGNYISAIAANGTVTCQPDNAGPANAFVQNGNAFGATAVLGTTDNNAIDVRASGGRVMRYEPDSNSPNLIGGSPTNAASPSNFGQVIAGGGTWGNTCYEPSTGTNTRSCGNQTASIFGTVTGGAANVASGISAWVGAGLSNTASGDYSGLVGGYGNLAAGFTSAVAGGNSNSATGLRSAVAGGGGNIASGQDSIVLGGFGNIASGTMSLAAGRHAKTQTPGASPTVHDGAFVWADMHVSDFNSQAANEFAVRATGGVRFVTAVGSTTRTFSIAADGQVTIPIETPSPNLTLQQTAGTDFARLRLTRTFGTSYWDIAGGSLSDVLNFYRNGDGNVMSLTPGGADLMVMSNGAHLTAGGAWTNASDRNAKENFTAIDPQAVLARVAELPVTQWNYRMEPGVMRIGPTAQDFRAAFGLGDADGRSIATVDADGVALAAIQGLNAKVEAQAREIAELHARYRSEIGELRRAVELLMARTSPAGKVAER